MASKRISHSARDATHVTNGDAADHLSPIERIEKLSFIRSRESHGGFNAWNPKALKKKDVRAVVERMRVGSIEDSVPSEVEFRIGYKVGEMAADEYLMFVLDSEMERNFGGLSLIAQDMHNGVDRSAMGVERRRGEIEGFFSKIDAYLNAASKLQAMRHLQILGTSTD